MHWSSLLLYYPILLFFTLMGIGGIIHAMKSVRTAYQTKKESPPTAFFLVIGGIITNTLLFLAHGPIPTRHIREIISLLAPFVAMGIIVLVRQFNHKKALLLILLVCTISVTQEFYEFGRYERSLTIDWDYLKFFSWMEKNMPQRAIILTDMFTLHTAWPALVFTQSPKENQTIRAKVGPGFDAREIIFGAHQEDFKTALQLECPDYIIIDSVSTGQFYPVTLQQKSNEFKDLIALRYEQRTRTSLISVWEVLPKACNP